MNKIKVGIVGATGYTGVELLRLLSLHPAATINVVTSNSEKGSPVTAVFPSLRGFVELDFEAHDSPALGKCDLVFFATPHATAMHQVPALLQQGCKIIDLSADFRIADQSEWERWYQVRHRCPELLKTAVYGLPELNRDAIKQAQLVANPGCYPTAIIMALLPALKGGLIKTENIIADAKSAVSGAGRKAAMATQFTEVADSFEAYSVSGHRHHPEISQILNSLHDGEVGLTFVPHLVPMDRGIFATLYINQRYESKQLQDAYENYYRHETFVDVMPAGSHPATRSVRGTNMCRIALHGSQQPAQPGIVLSVIDNLVKGAAGQAIQNMNLMFDIDEQTGLLSPGLVP